MICLRCLRDSAAKIAEAPDGTGAWEVFYCERCNYSWRSSEEPEITKADRRDPAFQLDSADLESLQALNPIPQLKNK